MPTYNVKSLENLLCLEESEMSDKTGKINPERGVTSQPSKN
jgi:hypothetical protein